LQTIRAYFSTPPSPIISRGSLALLLLFLIFILILFIRTLSQGAPAMSLNTISVAVIAVIFFIIKYLNRTDTPKIKNLPEIPGVPLFGNLLQFGANHAKVARELATKWGPVFQVRLGNRVRTLRLIQFHV
jgi:hypothetical protein